LVIVSSVDVDHQADILAVAGTTRGYKKVTTGSDDDKLLHCPALAALQVISGKWKTRILWLLRERPFHFGELRRTLPGVSAKVLAAQIQELERHGLVARRQQSVQGVVHAFYFYTDYGRQLVPVLDALGNWGLDHERRLAAQA
jgi:DNA-binding HxlR family transcriptional regulator